MRNALSALILLGLAACGVGESPIGDGRDGQLHLQPADYASIAGWHEDDQGEALRAFMKSCAVFAVRPETAANGQGQLLAPVAVWRRVCSKANEVTSADAAQARAFFEENFVPFRATDGSNPSGLYTGYYEPLLKGSLTRKRPFVYPVYGAPPAGTPTYTRAQIDFNMLAGHAPVLAYVDDPIQLYFLHVQGSGRIQLEKDKILRVGYAASNGLPYVSIGKRLVEKGLLTKEEMSMQRLRQWLTDHPNDMWQVMWENSSYVFFRPLQGDPVGTQQAPLTAERSLAVDDQFIPLGMPVFVDTILPAIEGSPAGLYRRLLIAQDTGGAIKGPLRGDIFFGFGTGAEQHAGAMRSGGNSILLVPRALAQILE